MTVHFIWIGPRPLIYSDYLAMRTARVHSEDIILWVKNTTENDIYRTIEDEFEIKILPDSIYSKASNLFDKQKRPESTENVFLSDYLRYYLLDKYEGLYLDTDTASLRPIVNIEKKKPVLVGKVEGHVNNAIIWAEDTDMFSRMMKDAEALTEETRYSPLGPTFITKYARGYPNVFQEVPEYFFYYFHYSKWQYWFRENVNIDLSEIYLAHFNGRFSREFCQGNLTPEFIANSGCPYARIIRKTI